MSARPRASGSRPLSNNQQLIDGLVEDQMPHVRIAPADKHGLSPAVLADERAGTIALADHFWSLGHRRFGICAPPPGRPYLQRRNGMFLHWLADRGIASDGVVVAPFACEGSGMLSGRTAAHVLLGGLVRPSAIFAFNDEYAQGVMVGAQQLGVAVPDALSVAGFDDGAAAQFGSLSI
jgi:LacI family transcriptional regulator